MVTDNKLLFAPEVKAPKVTLYFDAALRFIALGTGGSLAGGLLFAVMQEFYRQGWQSAGDGTMFLLICAGAFSGAVIGVAAWRTFALYESIMTQYEADSANARAVRAASVNLVVLGDKNKVNVNSPQVTDGRTVVLKVQPGQRVVDGPHSAQFLQQAAGMRGENIPAVETVEPDYLDWMIVEMLETGNLSRAVWLRKQDPRGQMVPRAIWEAVIDALYSIEAITGDRSAKTKKFLITDFKQIISRLYERYPDGIVLQENGFTLPQGEIRAV